MFAGVLTTPNCLGESPKEVITKFEVSSKTIFKWFENNGMKANPDKRQMFVSKNGSFVANTGENKISDAITVKHLRVTFDNRLTFNSRVSKLWETASNEPHSLARVAFYTDQDKKKNTFFIFFIACFITFFIFFIDNCPLIWMDNSRSLNKFSELHERALRPIKQYIKQCPNTSYLDVQD